LFQQFNLKPPVFPEYFARINLHIPISASAKNKQSCENLWSDKSRNEPETWADPKIASQRVIKGSYLLCGQIVFYPEALMVNWAKD
jgi:hypothetical protein